MAGMSGEWLSSQAAAKLVGCHWRTIVRTCAAGKIPGAYKVGNEWQIPRAGLRAWRGPAWLDIPARPKVERKPHPANLPVVQPAQPRAAPPPAPPVTLPAPVVPPAPMEPRTTGRPPGSGKVPAALVHFLGWHGVTAPMLSGWKDMPREPVAALRYAQQRVAVYECGHPSCSCHRVLRPKQS